MPTPATTLPPRPGPLIAAATLLGLGLGGFLDGIVFHQLLQWHNLISLRVPPDTLERAKIVMFWDGVFHLGTWSLTVAGLAMLWRHVRRAEGGLSTTIFGGGLLLGWGLFNTLDSVFNHTLFGLHHVRDQAANPQAWNLGFLLVAFLQCAAGWMLIRRGRAERTDP